MALCILAEKILEVNLTVGILPTEGSSGSGAGVWLFLPALDAGAFQTGLGAGNDVTAFSTDGASIRHSNHGFEFRTEWAVDIGHHHGPPDNAIQMQRGRGRVCAPGRNHIHSRKCATRVLIFATLY
jgi:hypothetical protein